MFKLWSINKARPLRRRPLDYRQACDLADRLELRARTPIAVVPA